MHFSQCMSILRESQQQRARERKHGKTCCEDGEVKGAVERSETVAKDIEEMNDVALVKAFRVMQEQRVITYTRFERGFKESMGMGDLEKYQELCKSIGMEFSQISQRINAIETRLRKPGMSNTMADLVRKLQCEEKEKLMMTAALHLEHMRKLNLLPGTESDKSQLLIASSVNSLQSKLDDIVGRINDALDEITAELASMMSSITSGTTVRCSKTLAS